MFYDSRRGLAILHVYGRDGGLSSSEEFRGVRQVEFRRGPVYTSRGLMGGLVVYSIPAAARARLHGGRLLVEVEEHDKGEAGEESQP